MITKKSTKHWKIENQHLKTKNLCIANAHQIIENFPMEKNKSVGERGHERGLIFIFDQFLILHCTIAIAI